MVNYMKLDEAQIERLTEKIVQGVLAKIEPKIEANMVAINQRLSRIELEVAPIGGRTVHDIHGHLAVSRYGIDRLADSYERLAELVNIVSADEAKHVAASRRIDEVQKQLDLLKANGGAIDELEIEELSQVSR